MTENSYDNWKLLSDEAIERKIGYFVKKVRQQQNKTQAEIAEAANISRSTLSLLERGSSGSFKTLIQVLRVLGKLEVLNGFSYKEVLSPLALAKAQHKSKQRVRNARTKKAILNNKKTNW